MRITRLLFNQTQEWPLITANGHWDLSIWVNRYDLDENQIKFIQKIEKLATQKNIHVCKNPAELKRLKTHTCFFLGHNDKKELPLIKDIINAGKKLKGKFLILNACGGTAYTHEQTKFLLGKTKASQIYAYYNKIPSEHVWYLFQNLTNLACTYEDLLPYDAIDASIKFMYARNVQEKQAATQRLNVKYRRV